MNSTDHFGLKVLLSYDQNGYAYRSLMLENSAGTGIVNADVLKQLNFLNLPVMVEYSFGNRVRINLDAGVFAGMLLNSTSTAKFKEPLPAGQPSVVKSSSSDHHTVNYGIAVGFGLQIPILPKTTLDLDLRNSTGLKNVIQINGSNNKIETNCFAILAGISFQF